MYSVGRFRNPYDLMWCTSKYNFNISKQLGHAECPFSIMYGGKDTLHVVETGL